MNTTDNRDNSRQGPRRPVTNWLHPRVYALLVGFTVGFVLAAWAFAGSGVVDYLLAVVSGFFVMAVGLPLILSRVGRTNGGGARHDGDRKRIPYRRTWRRVAGKRTCEFGIYGTGRRR